MPGVPPEDFDEMPPSNVDMERELLGCLLVWMNQPSPDMNTEKALRFLEVGDFRTEVYQVLLRGMQLAQAESAPIGDMAAFRQFMYEKDLWAKDSEKYVPGKVEAVDIAECIVCATFPWHLPYYCMTLRRLRAQRAAIRMSEQFFLKSRRLRPDEWVAYVLKRAGEFLRWLEGSRRLDQKEDKGGPDASSIPEEK